METKFRRDNNHNYLILNGIERKDYQEKILLENKIPGLLPCQLRGVGANKEYYYEISSRQTLSLLYAKREMTYESIRKLMRSLENTYDELHNYLLDIDNLVLDPELIYLNMEDESAELVFYPDKSEVSSSFGDLAEFILNRTDHSDPKAVSFSYQFFKIAGHENFLFHDILKYIDEIDERYKAVESHNELQEDKPMEDTKTSMDGNSYRSDANDFGRRADTDKRTVVESKKPKIKLTARQILCLLATIVLCCATVTVFFDLSWGVACGVAALLCGIEGIVFIDRNKKKAELLQDDTETSGRWHAETMDSVKMKNKVYPEEALFSDQSAMEREFVLPNGIESGTVLMNPEITQCKNCLVPVVGGKEISLAQLPIIVGKAENCVDVVIDDKSVSRMHVRFFKENDEICMQDLNSTNGLYKNDLRLQGNEVVQLRNGDIIRIGNCEYTYC